MDLGDTPRGVGQDWVEKKLEVARGKEYRGDGTRERLEQVAKEAGVFLVVGVVEKSGGSLYCAVVYVCPREGCLGKRRKVMPTGSERLIWAQGSPSKLRAIATEIAGVKLTLAASICWENYMPLLRSSLYSQNVNLYLAPTADARETWLPLMQTITCEGRAFVLSANQCVRRKNLPGWIKGTDEENPKKEDFDNLPAIPKKNTTARRRSSVITKTEYNHEITWPVPEPELEPEPPLPAKEGRIDGTSPLHLSTLAADDKSSNPSIQASGHVETPQNHILALPENHSAANIHRPAQRQNNYNDTNTDEAFVCRGGSCIISPTGAVLAGPLWDTEEAALLTATVDFEDCTRGRLDLDVAGSYSRNDSFELGVAGLDIRPPPS